MRQSSPEVHTFFDEATNAACHIVKDPASNAVAIIDSILDYDAAAGRTETTHADKLIDEITRNDWQVAWILETHVHADHLSAAPYLAEKLGGKIAIGANITAVQKVFGKIFNAGTEFEMDGSQFDRLFANGDVFDIGNLNVKVMHTPGHTPACVTYVIGDAGGPRVITRNTRTISATPRAALATASRSRARKSKGSSKSLSKRCSPRVVLCPASRR